MKFPSLMPSLSPAMLLQMMAASGMLDHPDVLELAEKLCWAGSVKRYGIEPLATDVPGELAAEMAAELETGILQLKLYYREKPALQG